MKFWPVIPAEKPLRETVEPAAPRAVTAYTLESLMLEAAKIGRVWLSTSAHFRGWHCSIDAHVSAAGTSVEFKSEFGCATPSAAVEQCLARARVGIATMSGGKP